MRGLIISAGKSGARELATALLIFWAFIVAWLLFWIPKEDVSFYKETFGTISFAIFTFGGGAFGIASVMNRLPTQTGPAPHLPLSGDRPQTKREID